MYHYPYDDTDDKFECFKWRETDEYLSMICQQCRGVAISHRGNPFDIVVRRDPKIFNPGHPGAAILPIPYADFLKAFDHDKEIVWGSVLIGKLRKVSERYVTAYMPATLTMHTRGDRRSIYYACSTCGSRSSSMYENGRQYISSEWSARDILFSSGRCSPYISAKLRDLFDWAQFPKVEFELVPVQACPTDGFRLPGDPDWAKICPGFESNPRQDWTRPSPRKANH